MDSIFHGKPPQLGTQKFYDDCYRALAPDGLRVVNRCWLEGGRSIERIRRSFDDLVLAVMPDAGKRGRIRNGRGTLHI
jgi:spermidine synthase